MELVWLVGMAIYQHCLRRSTVFKSSSVFYYVSQNRRCNFYLQ